MIPGEIVKGSLRGKILFPHQWIHTICLSCFAETETLQVEKLTINDGMLPSQAVDPRPVGPEVCQLTHHQPIRRMSTS